jgi:hypothetical protein
MTNDERSSNAQMTKEPFEFLGPSDFVIPSALGIRYSRFFFLGILIRACRAVAWRRRVIRGQMQKCEKS